MKTLVIGLPESLPPELADNPDVIVVDPETLPPEVLEALDAAAGGMLMAEDGEQDGGEGPLEEWAGEEEKEHGMGGYGEDDEDKDKGGGADDEEKEKDPLGGEGDDDERAGMGDDDEEEKKRAEAAAGGSRGGKRGNGFGVTISGRGAAIPALSAWARAMGRGAGR